MSRSKLNEYKTMYSLGLINRYTYDRLIKNIYKTTVQDDNKGDEMARKKKDDADLEFRRNLLRTIIIDDCKATRMPDSDSYAIVTRLQIPNELLATGNIQGTIEHLEKLKREFTAQINNTIQDIKDRDDAGLPF